MGCDARMTNWRKVQKAQHDKAVQTLAAVDALPKKLREELNFCARRLDAEHIAALFHQATADIGRKQAIDWLQRSMRAFDDENQTPVHRAAGASVLRYVPPHRPRRTLKHKLAPEVRTVANA